MLIAINKSKPRKAAGSDGGIGEMMMYAGDCVVDFLVKLFDTLFDEGLFPENWTKFIIFPLFKKGTVNDPNNYRSISLCDVSSKLNCSIINSRLQELIDQNDVTGEWQAGRKRNYSTADHILHYVLPYRNSFYLIANFM